MKVFVHLALDEFGAEAAGKVHRELVSTASPRAERHIYVWCGPGPAPSEPDYWSDRFPQWDDSIVWPEEVPFDAKDWDFDRSATASAIAGWDALRDKLQGWLEFQPKRLLGAHEPYRCVIVATGSLAVPITGALLIGILTAASRFRRMGILDAPIYAVLGVGLAGAPPCREEEKCRALIVRNLLDLAEFFRSRSAHEVASPVYLVGEALLDGGVPGRQEQVTTAAMTTFGLTRAIAVPATLPLNATDPFFFQVDATQRVHFANRVFDPERPFSAMGAYAVSCPAEPLARLFAARVAAVCMEKLGAQKCCASLEDAGKLDIPFALRQFLDDAEGRSVAYLWEQVAEKTKIPWPQGQATRRPEWYDLEHVRLLYGRLFDQKDWDRVMACYGEERLESLPLDLWPGALDEMMALIEQGVLLRRTQQIALLSRRILLCFLDATERGVQEVFGQTFREPVLVSPHLSAQALLGSIQNHLEVAQQKLEAIEAAERPTGQEPAELRRLARESFGQFQSELAAVPSPAAIILRAVPWFALWTGLPLALPFDLGVLNPPALRLAAGAFAGTVAVGWLLMRHLDGVRRRLHRSVRVWMERYKAALELEDRRARDQAYRELLGSMKACLQWFFNGHASEPPIPKPPHPTLKHQNPESPQESDILEPQAVLSHFPKYLGEAAESFRKAEARFLEDFQVSRRETNLPELSVVDPSALDRELERLGADAPRIAPDWMRNMETLLENASTADWVMPFRDADHSSNRLWRASFLLPSPKDLLEESNRARSSGFQFLETIRHYITERFVAGFSLSTRFSEYLAAYPGRVMGATELSNRYSSLAVPSVLTGGPSVSLFVCGSGPEDPLAAHLNWSNDMGADHISLHVQVRNFLSADDVIFYPNDTAPTQALGLAWKAYLRASWEGRAFQPMMLPKESA